MEPVNFSVSHIKDAGGNAQQVRNADVVAASSVVECYELHRGDFLKSAAHCQSCPTRGQSEC